MTSRIILSRNDGEDQNLEQNAQAHGATHILTLQEIAGLAAESGQPAATLMNIVALIANRIRADVCSVYLLEPDRANLALAATHGLRPQCVGTLRMGLHEGLVGLVAEKVRPVVVELVKDHPRFKYFSEAGEDAFQSFLGVPIIDRAFCKVCSLFRILNPESLVRTKLGC